MHSRNTSSRSTNKRKYIRLKSILPVEFRIIGPADSPWQQGYTCNVSEGGICLETVHLDAAVLHQIGKTDIEVEVSMRIPLHRPPVKARAKIAWFRHLDLVRPTGSLREEKAPHYTLGLQFTEIAYADCDRMLGQARLLSVSFSLWRY